MRKLVSLVVVAALAPAAAAERVAPTAGHGAPAGPRAPQLNDELAVRALPRSPAPPPPPPPRRAVVRKALAQQRAHHVAAFRAYRKRAVFAHDLDRTGEVYVWRDDDGHLDAVAAIMAADGKVQAQQVDTYAPQMVGVHLTDVPSGDVDDWMVVSGFSRDELDRLQRPHTRPAIVIAGDDGWRSDEDARLAKAYTAVDAYLASHTDDGLDAATDELMRRSDLAWQLVDPKHHPRANVTVRPLIPEPRRPRPRARR